MISATRFKSKFKRGDRSGELHGKTADVEHVRRDGLLVVHFDGDPREAIVVLEPSTVTYAAQARAARSRKKDEWSELGGGRDRDARALETSLREILDASNRARTLVLEARAVWSPTWARKSKDLAGEAFNGVQRAVESGEITKSTAGRSIDSLPRGYPESHVFSRAHVLRDKQAIAVEQARVLKKELSRALTGDPDKVCAALDHLLEDQTEARGVACATRSMPWLAAGALAVTTSRVPADPFPMPSGARIEVVEVKKFKGRRSKDAFGRWSTSGASTRAQVRVLSSASPAHVGRLYWVDADILEPSQ